MRSQACLNGVADLRSLRKKIRNPYPFECWSSLEVKIEVLIDLLDDALMAQAGEMSKEENQYKNHSEE